MLTNRQLFLNHLGQTSASPMLLEISKAEGVFMYSPNGKKYLDLISGVSVSNTGHAHPEIVQAIKDQADSYAHLMVYGEIIQTPQLRYAERLVSILPSSLNSVYFVNSGSEAVEGALKLAKRSTGRSRIVSFRNAYHGSTHGALSIQGSELYKNAFRPLLPDTFLADLNDDASLDLIDEKTACVIIEPIQGEAGVIASTRDFLGKLRSKCSAAGTLLVFDEIQTGFGRTGTMFAFEGYGVIPDILLLAKALGGGMPLGAFIASAEIMAALTSNPQLGHITTFGGHPVCCAAGMAALNVITRENLAEKSVAKNEQFKLELNHSLISNIRGEGLLIAVELNDPKYIPHIISAAPDHGLILDYFLFCNNAFRIAPPLTINSDEISLACRLLKELLDDVMKKAK